METELLEKLGLTPGEIKAYLALLKLGPSSTGPIAKESQVSRSKLYSILDKLEKRGLVSHILTKGVIYFQASEPSKIMGYIKEKETEIKMLEENFEKFLPQLEEYYRQAGKTQEVKVYQGTKGLITAHEHTYLKLKRGEEYFYIGIPKYQPPMHEVYWRKDHKRRAEAGIRCKLLFNRDTSKELLKLRNNYKGCDARYMPASIKTPAYFLIYKDTVMIAMPVENPIVVEITSQQIADAFMAYFWEFWKRSKPFKY